MQYFKCNSPDDIRRMVRDDVIHIVYYQTEIYFLYDNRYWWLARYLIIHAFNVEKSYFEINKHLYRRAGISEVLDENDSNIMYRTSAVVNTTCSYLYPMYQTDTNIRRHTHTHIYRVFIKRILMKQLIQTWTFCLRILSHRTNLLFISNLM